MDKKIILSMIICTLLILPAVANAEQNVIRPKIITTFYDENVPTWTEGDYWTYNVDCSGSALDLIEFDWHFNNLRLSVDEVTGSSYKMKINGDVTGEITAGIVKGTLKDTTISGDAIYEQSNTGIKSLIIQISGKILLLPLIIDITVSFNPAYIPIEWPLSVGKQFDFPFSNANGKLDFTYGGILIFDDLDIPSPLGGQKAKCTELEAKAVAAGTFNAYRVEGVYDDIEFYYASEVGNIISTHVASDDGTIFNLELKSYSYNGEEPGAPNKPSKPYGPSNGETGEEYPYTSVTTDPQNDQISYLFDWGDGTTSNWLGLYDSGDVVTARHIWTEAGSYSIKVKAKDINGAESGWSDPLSVTMPRSRTINPAFFSFLQNHPLVHQLLLRFLRL